MNWTREFPKVDGIYWYTDHYYMDRGRLPQLVEVKARAGDGDNAYVCRFGFDDAYSEQECKDDGAWFYGPLNICPPSPLNPV